MKFAAATLLSTAAAQDPAGGWMAYAVGSIPSQYQRITKLEMTWTVGEAPSRSNAFYSPWFGMDPADNLNLLQPVNPWEGSGWEMYTEYYQWRPSHNSNSKAYTVKAGQTLHGTVEYVSSTDSYTLTQEIVETGAKSSQVVKCQSGKKYTIPYVVYEKEWTCKDYPPDGVVTFHDIIVECDGTDCTQNVNWNAKVKDSNCNMKAHVEKGAKATSENEISITWNTKMESRFDDWTAKELIEHNAKGWGEKYADAALQRIEFEEIVEEVNAANNGWEAQVPEKFESLEDVKAYLGAFLPGDAEYQEEPEEPLATTVEAPASFDAIERWPQCTVISNVRDQSACGSCWAFGSVSSFESRACISTGKDIKYSPEDTAFCSNAGNGCSGGNSAWGYFKSTGVVTGGDYTDRGTGNSCYPYSLAPCAHHVPATSKYPACPSGEYPSPRCGRSCSESGYSKSFSADKVRASSSKSIRGESAMIQELVQNGPIYVSFTVYGDFPTYKSGVYKHTSGSYLGGHAVTLVGYGELNGQKYWKIKNSWNEQWGNNGHFLIARGTGECGIESGGSAGTVSAATVV